MRSLKVVIVGGGPAGLLLARLLRLRDPSTEVIVYERSAAEAVFGFGVVLSARTMSALNRADPATGQRLERATVGSPDMELRHRGEVLRYRGHGLAGISRRRLLRILREQAAEVGADLRFGHEVGDIADGGGLAGFDVVALASGANCALRDGLARKLGTQIETVTGRHIWFGTHAPFEHVTLTFVVNEIGAFGGHAYPYEDGTATFIVTADDRSARAAGMGESTERCSEPGRSDDHARRLMEEVFREDLHGYPLLVNNTKWTNFRVVRNTTWSYGNVVLLGDAAHTAHPSVGSGTKMAMEDAVALADALLCSDCVPAAFDAYEQARRPVVSRSQLLAEPSMLWWETFRRRMHFDARQLGFHYLTRTGAMSYAGLRQRDAGSLGELETWFTSQGATAPLSLDAAAGGAGRPAEGTVLASPVALDSVIVPSRVVAAVVGRDAAAVAAFVSYAVAGGGLVVADWTGGSEEAGPSPPGVADPWRMATAQVRRVGAVPAAMVAAGGWAAADWAAEVGMAVLEVAAESEDDAGLPDVCRLLRRRTRLPLLVKLRCPSQPAAGPDGNRFAATCRRLTAAGASGFHLGLDAPVRGLAAWRHLTDYADRIRTETRTPVLVDGPDAWAVSPPSGADDGESWGTRMHVAVLAGRVDLVAAWPLPPSASTTAPTAIPSPSPVVPEGEAST